MPQRDSLFYFIGEKSGLGHQKRCSDPNTHIADIDPHKVAGPVGGPGTILVTGLVGDQSQAIKAVLDRLDHTLVYVRHLRGKGEIRMFLKSRLVVGSWAWREIGPAASRACLRASIPSSRVSSKFAT